MLRFWLTRLAAVLPTLFAGCAFHSTATHWNGHVGPDGEPVFVLSSSYVGLHFAIVLPLVGSTTVDEMIAESTGWILEHEGSRLRVIETEVDNYWYGIPPVSWLITPVMTHVSIEYHPSSQAMAAAGVEPPNQNPAAPPR